MHPRVSPPPTQPVSSHSCVRKKQVNIFYCGRAVLRVLFRECKNLLDSRGLGRLDCWWVRNLTAQTCHDACLTVARPRILTQSGVGRDSSAGYMGVITEAFTMTRFWISTLCSTHGTCGEGTKFWSEKLKLEKSHGSSRLGWKMNAVYEGVLISP